MIIRTELFQDACKKILEAVDSNVATIVSETLELEAHGDMLHLNVNAMGHIFLFYNGHQQLNIPVKKYPDLKQ